MLSIRAQLSLAIELIRKYQNIIAYSCCFYPISASFPSVWNKYNLNVCMGCWKNRHTFFDLQRHMDTTTYSYTECWINTKSLPQGKTPQMKIPNGIAWIGAHMWSGTYQPLMSSRTESKSFFGWYFCIDSTDRFKLDQTFAECWWQPFRFPIWADRKEWHKRFSIHINVIPVGTHQPAFRIGFFLSRLKSGSDGWRFIKLYMVLSILRMHNYGVPAISKDLLVFFSGCA